MLESNSKLATLMIALFGAIGVLFSAVHPSAQNRGIRNPFNLPIFQLLLKLALGPLFAVVGLAMITTQTTILRPPLELLVAAGLDMI